MKQAADEIRRHALKWKGLIAAADALDKIGSLEQLASEAGSRVAEVKAQEALAKAALEKVKSDIDKGLALVSEAKLNAEEIILNAQKKADGTMASATSEAKRIYEASMSSKARLEADVIAAKSTLASVVSEVDAAKNELLSVGKSLSDLRAQAAKFARV